MRSVEMCSPSAWGFLLAVFCSCSPAILITLCVGGIWCVPWGLISRCPTPCELVFWATCSTLRPRALLAAICSRRGCCAGEAGQSGQGLGLGHGRSDRRPLRAFPRGRGGRLRYGFWDIADTTVHRLCWAVLIVTFVSTVGIVLVLLPGFLEGPLMRVLTRIPKIGGAIESLLDAIRIYRSKRFVLFLTSLMTIPVHTLLTFSLFLLAMGLRFRRRALAGLFRHLSDQRHRSARFRSPLGRRKRGSFFSTRRHVWICGTRPR